MLQKAQIAHTSQHGLHSWIAAKKPLQWKNMKRSAWAKKHNRTYRYLCNISDCPCLTQPSVPHLFHIWTFSIFILICLNSSSAAVMYTPTRDLKQEMSITTMISCIHIHYMVVYQMRIGSIGSWNLIQSWSTTAILTFWLLKGTVCNIYNILSLGWHLAVKF